MLSVRLEDAGLPDVQKKKFCSYTDVTLKSYTKNSLMHVFEPPCHFYAKYIEEKLRFTINNARPTKGLFAQDTELYH